MEEVYKEVQYELFWIMLNIDICNKCIADMFSTNFM